MEVIASQGIQKPRFVGAGDDHQPKAPAASVSLGEKHISGGWEGLSFSSRFSKRKLPAAAQARQLWPYVRLGEAHMAVC